MKSKDVEALLQTKFHFRLRRRSTHSHFELRIEGLPPVRTHVSHGGNKDIGRVLLGAMARQMRVRPRFLTEMLSCTKDRDAYYAELRRSAASPGAEQEMGDS